MRPVPLFLAAIVAFPILVACGGGGSEQPATASATAADSGASRTPAAHTSPSVTTTPNKEGGLGAQVTPAASPTATSTMTPTATIAPATATPTQPQAAQPTPTPTEPPPPPTPTPTTAPGDPSFVSIGVAGNRWSPANVFLAPGGTVQWTWSGTPQPHEVTVEYSGASSDLATSGAFSSAFPQAPGTYAFRCAVHSDMTGTVTIR